jgi:hypothetical protein
MTTGGGGASHQAIRTPLLWPFLQKTTIMARNVSDVLFSSLPGSSQSQCCDDSEMVERAFWQSTPTVLQELRQGMEEEEEWHRAAREFQLLLLLSFRRRATGISHHLYNDRSGAETEYQVRQEETLRLSTEQSRLIRQTWTSTASTVRPDGETLAQTPGPSSQIHARTCHSGHGSATEAAATVTTPMCPDDSIFREIKNIEKVCMAVDERIQKRRAQKEWTTRVTSETARLRDDDANSNSQGVHVEEAERSPSYRPRSHIEAHVAEVDHRSDDYNVHPGPTQSTQEVPTSQSQERYLSLLSQNEPTDCFDARCAQSDDDHVGVTMASGASPTSGAALPESL